MRKLIWKIKGQNIEQEKSRLNLDDTAIYIFDKIFPGVDLRIGLEHIKINEETQGNIITIRDDKVNFNPINSIN
jgi:hypothetical protein